MAVRLSLGASRRQLIAQLLDRVVPARGRSAASPACSSRAGRSIVIASLLPADAAATLHVRARPAGAALRRRRSRSAPACCSGCSRRCTARGPISSTTLKSQAGQPSGGARGRALPHRARHGADRAVDGAARRRPGCSSKSLCNVSRVDLGLKIDNVVTFGVSPELNGYTPERSRALFERVEDELAALPGVTGVTAAIVPLLAGNNWGNNVVGARASRPDPTPTRNSRFNEVGAGYFRTLGMPLLAGREFTRADALGAPKVAIVNEAFAKKFNLGRERRRQAHGQRAASGTLDIEIVGLVQNAKYSEVKDDDPAAVLHAVPAGRAASARMTFYVRTALDAGAAPRDRSRRSIAQLDPNLPVENLRTMPQQVRENVFLDRFDQHAVGGVRRAGDAARGGRALRRARLHGGAAHARDRPAHGARRRRRRACAAMVLRQVGRDDARRRRDRARRRPSASAGRAQSLLFELQGYDPVVLAGVGRGARARRARRRLHPRAPRVAVDPMRALRYE